MKRLIALILSIVVLIVLVTGFLVPRLEEEREVTSRTYEGKVLLDDVDYSDLKHLLARSDVKIRELEVYSSSSHLVTFSVEIPVYIEFWYGEVAFERYEYTSRYGRWVFLTICALLAAVVLVYTLLPRYVKQ